MADENLSSRRTQQVAEFFRKIQSTPRGRLSFALDATQSRQPTWDTACELQAQMFQEAGRSGALEIQMVYYRGLSECSHSRWTSNARDLADTITRIVCRSGKTQIGKVLRHVRTEHTQRPVTAVVFVGDATEESSATLYDATNGLPPVFLFQEGDDPRVAEVFKELARLTKGAYEQFSPGAAHKLAELLRAVAAFAVGGMTALADLRTDGARKLLGQLSSDGARRTVR